MRFRKTAPLPGRHLTRPTQCEAAIGWSTGFLSELAERSAPADMTAPTTLARLMRNVMTDRVNASSGLLSLVRTDMSAWLKSMTEALAIRCASETLASLDLATGDLLVWVDGADAKFIAATGWGRNLSKACNDTVALPVRVMHIGAATSPDDVLVLAQIIEAAVVRVVR